MVDRNPEPEGLDSRCAVCGKRIVAERVVAHVDTISRGANVADYPRSKLCEAHKDFLTNTRPDEFDEIRRAGAT